MKRLFAIISIICVAVMLAAVPGFCGGCGGLTGDCYSPGFPNTGHLGTSDYPWGYGYFNSLTSTSFTTGTGEVGATEIADVTRAIPLPLAAAFIDGTGVVGNDGTTAPGLAEVDSIPAIVWADDEVTPVQWSFRVPDDYSSGMEFRLLASESSDTTPCTVDFALWVNTDGVVFDAAVTDDQTPVTLGVSAATNEVVTLTPTATAASAIAAGSWVTLDIWNTTTGNGSLEVKGVEAYYTAIQ